VVPCLIHLCGLSDQEFTMDFMKKLKEQGHRLSIDMQGFLWEVDNLTRAIRFKDLQEKEEILHMVEVVKLDQTEAKVLTGTDNLEKMSRIADNLFRRCIGVQKWCKLLCKIYQHKFQWENRAWRYYNGCLSCEKY